MLPKIAAIESKKQKSPENKIFGQYPLERNIRLLWQAGFSKIYLNLDDNELALFNKSVKKKLGKIISIIAIDLEPSEKPFLMIHSNQFMRYQHFCDPTGSFIKSGGRYIVVQNSERFILKNAESFRKAEKLETDYIRNSSGGWIARNINKRISIPASLVLAKTGVHPNIITIANFFIGITGASFMFVNDYRFVAAGGIIVQWASVIDGCDGEIAKMTSKFSRLGGLLDSISDHSLAIAAFSASAVQVYYHSSAGAALISGALLFYGLTLSLSSVFYYLFKYSRSRSILAYSKEFYDRISRKYFLLKFMDMIKYFICKEFYSLMICIFCVAGLIHYFAFFMSFSAALCGSLLLAVNLRFFNQIEKLRHDTAMVYLSNR